MGHSIFGGMQRLNIEAARRQAGQDLLQTPNPVPPLSGGGSGTPISLSTPDILNSIIAIANPFFESATLPDDTETLSHVDYHNEEPQEKKVFANLETPATMATTYNSQQQQQHHGLINTTSSMMMMGSPMSVTSTSTSTFSDVNSPPPPHQHHHPHPPPILATPSSSVESMRSKLIKDSLKLTIQTKRKNSGKEELDVKAELATKRPKREELTPEDEERRRRRRERNKVAATKCRNKKKERTVLLVQEAEVLETDNVTLKAEIAQMEEEFARLTSLMASHSTTCLLDQKPNISNPPTSQAPGPLLNSQDYGGHSSSSSSNNNNMIPHYATIAPSTNPSIHQQHDYGQDLNLNPRSFTPHHHNHGHNNNHFMVASSSSSNSSSNLNMYAFGGPPLHHQTIQLS